MYLDHWHVTEVWYCDQEGWEGWMVTAKDRDGDCLGESEHYHYKADAVDIAQAYFDSDRCTYLVVELKNGKQQYTRQAA